MNRLFNPIVLRKRLCVVWMPIFIFATNPSYGQAVPDDHDWNLVWSDEFDSGSDPIAPNPENWGYESGYTRNQEEQYYTDHLENAFCQNGLLNVRALKHDAGTFPVGEYEGQDGSVSSASLISRGKVEFQYGKLEIRARIDIREGSWPAFWTLGVNGHWPDNGECDIMEFYRGMLKFNVAWWEEGDRPYIARWDSTILKVESFPSEWADEFHVWSMVWTEEAVELYLDGKLCNHWKSIQDVEDCSFQGFKQPHFIILNQAIGGTEGGATDALIYPTYYQVDYVRLYKNSQLESQPKVKVQ